MEGGGGGAGVAGGATSTFELGLVMVHGVLGTSLLVLPQVFCTSGVLMGASSSRQDSLFEPPPASRPPACHAKGPSRALGAPAAAWRGVVVRHNHAITPNRRARAAAAAATHGVGARRVVLRPPS